MRQILTWFGKAAAHPAAFLILALYAIAWISLGHIDWHALRRSPPG